MAAKTGTYTLIASQTVSGGSTGTVTFSSIPQTYTDLVVVTNFGLGGAARLYLRFNGDTTSIYSDTWGTGEGATAYSGNDTNQNAMTVGGAWNGCSTSLTASAVISIMDYANTSTFKSVLSRLANEKGGSGSVDAVVGLWRSTSAITSVNVVGGNVFLSGSTIKLYGIEAGNL